MQESGIFKTAVKLPAAERAAYLDKACADNAALRVEVEGLLRAHDSPGEFMQRPPIADMTTDYRSGPERPGMRVGPYKLLQFLGEGGMGTVFVAEQTEPVRRIVALKIIKPGMDSAQILARFEAERQALALMDHPNIAKVLDAGHVLEPAAPANNGADSRPKTSRPYFAMELVKGVPITEFCDQNKLTTRQRLELFVPVCNAIQHAHMKGIIHRDIKPSNVLIALYDGKPVPKVIDFGVAKAMAEPLTQRTLFTQIGQVVGTFEYMSPEQATLNQLDIDTRSDIYSLGVLLYELLTGMTPFDKNRLRKLALDQMLKTIREEEPMRPSVRLSSEGGALAMAAMYRGVESSKLAGLIRGDLDWIVMKCLEKERNRRFATAGSLAQDIERYLHDEPVTACPPSLAYRTRKAYRKNKAAILVVTTIMALLFVGVIASSWEAIRATKAEYAAARDRDAAVESEKIANEKTAETTAALSKLSIAQDERRKAQYAWDMQIIQTAYDMGKIGKIQEMLDRHSPELRDFEWHFWNRQLHSDRHSVKLGNESERGRPIQNSWHVSEDGQRAFNIVSVIVGEDPVEGLAGLPMALYQHFLEVYDTKDGKRLCRHPLNEGKSDPASAILSSGAFAVVRHGDRVAVTWLNSNRSRRSFAPDQPRSGPSYTLEYRLIDVAADRTIEKLTQDVGNSLVLFPCPDGKRWVRLSRPPAATNGASGPCVMSVCELQAGAFKEAWQVTLAATTLQSDLTSPLLTRNPRTSATSDSDRTAGRIAAMKVDPTDETKAMITVWDIATGKELMSLPNTLPGAFELVLSPDGKHLAAWSYLTSPNPAFTDPAESTLMVMDVDTGKERLVKKKVTRPSTLAIRQYLRQNLHFSPSGSRVYFLDQPSGWGPPRGAGKLVAWDLATGDQLMGLDCELDIGQNQNLVFSPDGTRFVTRSGNALQIHDATTGRVLHTLRGHVQGIREIVPSADGRRLYSIDTSGEFKEWDALPPEPVTLADASFSALSPDGRYLADYRVRSTPAPSANRVDLWDRTDGALHSFQLPPLPVEPNGPNPVETPTSPAAIVRARMTQFSPNGALVAFLRSKANRRAPANESDEQLDFADLTVFDVATRKQVAHLTLPFICALARISADGKFAVFATSQGEIKCFDLDSGREIWTSGEKGPDRATLPTFALQVSPDGRLVACAGLRPRDGSAPGRMGMQTMVLDMATGREVRSFSNIMAFGTGLEWSPDSSRIAINSARPSGNQSALTTAVAVFDVATGKTVMKVERGPGGVVTMYTFAFSPDGRRLAGYMNRTPLNNEPDAVKVWDTDTGTELLNLPLVKPSDTATRLNFSGLNSGGIAFSPDGHRIICAERTSFRGRVTQGQVHTTLRVIDATPVEEEKKSR
jgi:serine/threonine protein kinase/WD40 repeat protein